MACIDKTLSNEQVEERLDRYSLGEMTEGERTEFELHFAECDYCKDKALSGLRITRILKRKFTYEQMVEALKRKKYDEVISLAEKMRQLGYRESVHPINHMIKKAYAGLKKNEEKRARKTEKQAMDIMKARSDSITKKTTARIVGGKPEDQDIKVKLDEVKKITVIKKSKQKKSKKDD